jgi:hypothetical protein
MPKPSTPQFSGNTSVTVVLTSTANDQLSEFDIGFLGMTLTSQSGKTVSLLSTPQGTEQVEEFIHVNGAADPLITATVPQDVYTAATVTVDQSSFTCQTLAPAGGLVTHTYAYGTNPNDAPTTDVTVNLDSPITITGSSMGLSVGLQVSQSATYSSCYDPNGIYTYSITPTFNLAPIAFLPQPTNSQNGKVSQLDGEITAISTSGSSFTLSLPEGPRSLSIGADASTAYQGISNFSALAVGTFVDMDGTIQPNGSLLASRIAVEDPSAVDVQSGPALIVGGDPLNGEPAAWFFNRLSQGQDPIPNPWAYNISDATFQISGQLSNLQSLPFVPAFDVSNIVAGENAYITTHQFSSASDPYTVASTVTLMPQTINANVVGSSTAGNFTDYTVQLASYDLFPTLAVQAGQTTLLNNPSQVEVYIDNNTQMLNSQPLAAGSNFRFYGLVFNDNGTLRMDCAQVNDGVAFSPQPSASQQAQTQKDAVLQIRREGSGPLQQIISVITRQP